MADETPTVKLVAHLPDLMQRDDYLADGHQLGQRTVKFRITVTPEGIAILGDSQHPLELDELLTQLGARKIEQTLCG